jgi:[lysine-biosynthesis-protein LysW]---L-2-aminoadipate ligase
VAVVAWKAAPTNVPLVEAWRRLGIRAELLSPHEAARELGRGDVALARLDVTPGLDGVEPGLPEVSRLARRGVRVLNGPAALLAAHDKWQTAERLTRAGIPHPWTIHRTVLEEIRGVAPPFVLKPRFGSWGQDVMLCRGADDLERCLAILGDRQWFRRHGVLLQELIPPAGLDLRLIVAGQRVVGAEQRHAAPGEWRTNEALGGRSMSTRPRQDACALALQAARAIGTDLVGIDLLPLPDGRHVVIEVNGAVDFNAADSLPGRDVYRDAAGALELLPTTGTRTATTAERPSAASLRPSPQS